jgi:hypothetical protein
MLEQQLKDEFTAFYNERLFFLLPDECRYIKPAFKPIRTIKDGKIMYNLTCIVKNCESGNSKKASLPEDLRIRQELGTFERSNAGALSILRVMIETEDYIFKYPQ